MSPRAMRVRALNIVVVCVLSGALAAYVSAQTRTTTTAPRATPSPAASPAAGGVEKPMVVSGLTGPNNLNLLVNKSAVIATGRPYRRISVGSPDILEANAIGPQRILVTAKKAGATQLILWDEQDNSQMIDVLVQNDLRALRELYPVLFPDGRIEVVSNEGTIALTGRVPDLQTAEQAATLAQSYGNKVLNLLEISGGQQVCIQVRFAEVSRSAISALGVNMAFSDGRGLGASNVGQLTPFNSRVGEAAGLGIPDASSAITMFGRAQVGDTTIWAFLNALRQNNLARVLAEPNLVTSSGQEAQFLAGGEFPIPITQGGTTAGGLAISIEFKKFGVQLGFTPVVLGNGRIRLKVVPEVSDLDFATAPVRLSGFSIPGLVTRRTSTTVEMAEGQTLAIAGLLNHNIAAQKDVTPVLGDLPVLGALFRSVRYQKKETELVCLVTPRLVSSLKPGEVPALPGEHWREPNEAELFLNQDIGGPAKDLPTRPPRPFIGRYGFAPATQPSGSEMP